MNKWTPSYTEPPAPKPKFTRPELLLHPNIPKPLHGINPRTIIGEEWWDIQRHKAYKRNNYCCWACGVHKSRAKYHKWLEAHEYYIYDYVKGEAKLKFIVALCYSCHNFIHSGRLTAMQERCEISENKYKDIMTHGLKILKDAGLQKPIPPSSPAKWEDWHLRIGKKKYYSQFKNYEEWYEHYYERKG